MKYEKNGQTFEFRLDLDRIADMEEADPDFDIMATFESMVNGKARFADLRRVIRVLGIGDTYKDMSDKGLVLDDLMSICTGCIEDLGFHSETQEPDTSSPTAE